jgi:hypothetical protein
VRWDYCEAQNPLPLVGQPLESGWEPAQKAAFEYYSLAATVKKTETHTLPEILFVNLWTMTDTYMKLLLRVQVNAQNFAGFVS